MANEYLKRTPTSTGNRKVWTWSSWAKRSKTSLAVDQMQLYAGDASTFTGIIWGGTDGDKLVSVNYANSILNGSRGSDNILRDSSSWYHILVSYDSTLGAPEERIRLYINGVRILSFSEQSDIGINIDTTINNIVEHNIGRRVSNSSNFLQGELFDVFLVDGQALTPDVFGLYKDGNGYISAGSTQATDFRPGQWVPKSPRIIKAEINRRGGFGVNGFYLPMNNSNNFGADFHCTPDTILKLKENLPQPKAEIDGNGDYTNALREDPFKQYLVLAIPFVSGGLQDGFGDYSAAIKGSGSPKIMSNGNISITSIASYYGTSANYQNANSYVDTPGTSGDFNMGTGDFTIEGWFYPTGNGGNARLFGQNTNTYNAWDVYIDGTSSSGQLWMMGGAYQLTSTNIQGNQWNHIAISRKNLVWTTYINGVAAGIVTNVVNNTVGDSTNKFRVGQIGENAYGGVGYGFQGYIQDFRVYKGVAKYKGGFDVPKPYTPVGIGTWRAVPDTTANNFATLNPLYPFNSNNVYTNGNLKAIANVNYQTAIANMGFSSGKWYWETRNYRDEMIGIADATNNFGGYPGQNQYGVAYHFSGSVYQNGPTGYGAGWVADTYHVIGCAIDWDNKRVYWHVDGVWANNANPEAGTGFWDITSRSTSVVQNSTHVVPAWRTRAGTVGEQISVNFGQNPTFGGEESTPGTYTDSNGKGLFKYEPPAGFLALCSDNLPTPAISDPGKHFKTVLWTGDGNIGRSITGVGFKPDLIWIKSRSFANNHHLFDVIRGPNNILRSSTTGAETNPGQVMPSFNSDGFTVGEDGSNNATNDAGSTFVGWCWKAGGEAVTNNDGTITSQVSANQDAGFSIVSWTGNGATTEQTIGHGLNKSPSFTIIKARDTASFDSSANEWWVYFGSNDLLRARLNNTSSAFFNNNDSAVWNGTYSDRFRLIANGPFRENNVRYIAYTWAEIEGFSKFGSYVGNENADGPFVYCGFKPAFVLIKNAITTGTYNWYIVDNARSSANPVSQTLAPNLNVIEDTAWTIDSFCDFTSNGFKIRGSNLSINKSGDTIIFAAFAESPFTTANAK